MSAFTLLKSPKPPGKKSCYFAWGKVQRERGPDTILCIARDRFNILSVPNDSSPQLTHQLNTTTQVTTGQTSRRNIQLSPAQIRNREQMNQFLFLTLRFGVFIWTAINWNRVISLPFTPCPMTCTVYVSSCMSPFPWLPVGPSIEALVSWSKLPFFSHL